MITNNSKNYLQDYSYSQAISITHEESIDLWERRRIKLMKLSKEELVELIIGKREYIGVTFV